MYNDQMRYILSFHCILSRVKPVSMLSTAQKYICFCYILFVLFLKLYWIIVDYISRSGLLNNIKANL